MSSTSIWDSLPINIARPDIQEDVFWNSYANQENRASLHLSILANIYLEMILSHNKTIESRFSVQRRMPYERVAPGDVLLLKQTGGPIRGIAYVENVWFYRIENDTLAIIKKKFGKEMQIQSEDFWKKCETSTYATLMKLSHVKKIAPIAFPKRDRNAWAILQNNVHT